MPLSMYHQSHTIIQLAIHLPDQQNVYFIDGHEGPPKSRQAWYSPDQSDKGGDKVFKQNVRMLWIYLRIILLHIPGI